MHDKTDVFAWGLWEQKSYVMHDLTLTTWLTVDDEGFGAEEVSSGFEVGVVEVEGMSPVWEVSVWGVEGVSVGGGAPVEEVSVGGGAPVGVVGAVVSEVLLSEKQGIVMVKMDLP